MDITFYAIGILVVALLAFIGTLAVARNPESKNYGATTRKRYTNILIIYGVFTIALIFGLVTFILKHID